MFTAIQDRIQSTPRTEPQGRITQMVGLVAESTGPASRLGDVCLVQTNEGDKPIQCEVVGFRREQVLLMPLGDIQGVQPGSLVRGTGSCLRVPVGNELLGRVINGLGEPIDGKGPILAKRTYPNLASAPSFA